MQEQSILYGKNSVQSFLTQHPDRVSKIYMSDSLKPDKRIDAIYQLAGEHGILIQKAPRTKLDRFFEEPDTNHQGVVALVTPKPLLPLEDLIADCQAQIATGQKPWVLMLDGVTDPHNFGALLRVADAAGARSVIFPKHHSAPMTPVVTKAASGAAVDLTQVTNLTQSLEKLKKAGFWVVGSSLKPKSQVYDQLDFNMSTVLVLGSEGVGLSRLVEEHCDFLVQIPMRGTVQSLNVSTAAAVLAFEILRQQRLNA